jgi:hypothetical protein
VCADGASKEKQNKKILESTSSYQNTIFQQSDAIWRLLLISKFLHLEVNDNVDENNKLRKVLPAIDCVNKKVETKNNLLFQLIYIHWNLYFYKHSIKII